MEFREPFVAVMVILQESFKLLPKNGKLMALLLIVPSLLSSLFFLIFYFSIKSLLQDMLVNDSFDPVKRFNNPDFTTSFAGLNGDFGLMLAVDFFFILAYSFISLYSTIATILVCASSHNGRILSYKDLRLLTVQAWKRQYITRFYNSLLSFGYIFFVLFAASPMLVFSGNSRADVLPIAILLGIAASIWYMYLSTVWVLGIVISVIEENCYGIEALGKAGKLIHGNRIPGFTLNAVFPLILVVLFQGLVIIRNHKWLVNDIILGLFFVNFSCLVRFFYFVGYTVLYFQCKKNHGEEIELQGAFEYSKVSTKLPVADIP